MKKQKNYPFDKVAPLADLHDLLDRAASEAGDRIAYKYFEGKDVHERTFAQFRLETIWLGTALASIGYTGGHAACIGENSYRWIVAYLTILNSDGVFVPVDRELTESDMLNVLNSSDSDLLFVGGSYEKLIPVIREKTGIRRFISLDAEEDSEDGVLSLRRLMDKGRELYEAGDTGYTSQRSDRHALKLLVYTSGTTGVAKGVMLSEHNLVSMVYYGLQVSGVYDVGLSVLPYHHTYESVAGLLVAMHNHSTLCINDKLRNIQKNMQLFRPHYIYVVPAIAEAFYKKIWANIEAKGKTKTVNRLIKLSRALLACGIDVRRKLFKTIHDSFGGRLIKVVCGGAPIRPEIGRFFGDLGIYLCNGYGITECSPLISANRDRFNDYSTVGVVLPCLEFKIEPDGDEEYGEICVKGDTVMLGYYKNPEETAKAIVDGWFHTGDYGMINEHGQVTITGRKKNIIVLNNGKNIYPEEIESLIMNIPYVSEVVVSAEKAEDGSEVGLCAEAFLDAEKLTESGIDKPFEALKHDIAAICRQLPVYKQITNVKLRDTEFEKTSSRKIRRFASAAKPAAQTQA